MRPVNQTAPAYGWRSRPRAGGDPTFVPVPAGRVPGTHV